MHYLKIIIQVFTDLKKYDHHLNFSAAVYEEKIQNGG